MRSTLLTALLMLTLSPAYGEEQPSQPFEHFKAPDGQSIPKPIQLTNGDIAIGKAVVSRQNKSVHIPVYINLEEGIIEYILCLPNGKIHEALLLTEADPLHISVAMKLAGFQAFEKLFPEQDENLNWKPFSPPKPQDYAKAQVRIELVWKKDGKECRSDLSNLLINTKSRTAFPSGDWFYTNSYFFRGHYQSSLTGDVIAIFADRGCLINYIGPNNDGNNESGWIVNPSTAIPSGTPATLIITPINPPHQPTATATP